MVTAEKIVVSAKRDSPIGMPIFDKVPIFAKDGLLQHLKIAISVNGLFR